MQTAEHRGNKDSHEKSPSSSRCLDLISSQFCLISADPPRGSWNILIDKITQTFRQYTRRTVVRRELGRTRANSRELRANSPSVRQHRHSAELRRTFAGVRRTFAGVRRSSPGFARVRPYSAANWRTVRQKIRSREENHPPLTSSPRTGPPRTTFADGELQFAKKHILDGVHDRSPRTVVRQRRTSSLGEIKF